MFRQNLGNDFSRGAEGNLYLDNARIDVAFDNHYNYTSDAAGNWAFELRAQGEGNNECI